MARQRRNVRENPIPLPPAEIPSSYQGGGHPIIPTARSCTECVLGRVQEGRNFKAEEEGKDRNVVVCGAGPSDLSKVKVIVMSDHPGAYESQESRGYPMFDNRLRETGEVGQRLNAGGLIRLALEEMFNLNTYTQCWFTNAVRCNPQEGTIMEASIRKCAGVWGKSEVRYLDEYCAEAPLLVAGNHAFRSLRYLYPGDWEELRAYGIGGCLRRDDLRVGEVRRPLVVTMNPAAAARSDWIVETDIAPGYRGIRITGGSALRPFMKFSPLWRFEQDLRVLGNWVDYQE